MWWHAYECDEVGCSRGPTGCVLDVRIDSEEALEVVCPFCKKPMGHRASWPATESGHGSRGSAPDPLDLVEAWLETVEPVPPGEDSEVRQAYMEQSQQKILDLMRLAVQTARRTV